MKRIAALFLLIAMALAALPASAAPPAEPAINLQASQPGETNPAFMGMVIRDPWYDFGTNPAFPGQANQTFQDTMGSNLEQLGVRWVRLDMHIPLTYTAALDSEVMNEIAKNDYFINVVAPQHNLKVLALLNFSLVGATDPHELNSPKAISSRFGGGVNQYMDSWLTRALLIADRYREKIAGYEVLNEENRLTPDGVAIQPAIMARLLTKFYRFCKNIDPTNENHGCSDSTQIILGGIHPRGTLNAKGANPTDAKYLELIYSDSAFTDFNKAYSMYPVDGIGYHPYPEEIRLSPNDAYVNHGIDRMRAVLNAVDPGKQFWITEVGYNVGFDPDGSKKPMPVQTEAGQVTFMRDVYSSLAARGDVANVFWFKYEDFPPASGANAQRWGVVRIPFSDGDCPGGACYDPSGTPVFKRAAFLAYRALAGLPLERTLLPLVSR